MEKERRRQEQAQMIEDSRKTQIEKRNMEKENMKKDEKEFAEFWKIRNEELHLQEEQEKEEIRQRNAQLKNFQKAQVEIKSTKIQDEYKRKLEEASQSNALLDHQEKQFYSYAEQCIKEWQDKGKNVTPLILELKNYKKQI